MGGIGGEEEARRRLQMKQKRRCSTNMLVKKSERWKVLIVGRRTKKEIGFGFLSYTELCSASVRSAVF